MATSWRYYLSFAKELKSFFDYFLDRKLTELNNVVDSADRNIQRYNTNVIISNNNLTKGWIDQLRAIRLTREAALGRLSQPYQIPAKLDGFEAVSRRRAEINMELGNDAQRAAQYVEKAVKREILLKIRTLLRGLRQIRQSL
jgi:hypothetical protein